MPTRTVGPACQCLVGKRVKKAERRRGQEGGGKVKVLYSTYLSIYIVDTVSLLFSPSPFALRQDDPIENSIPGLGIKRTTTGANLDHFVSIFRSFFVPHPQKRDSFGAWQGNRESQAFPLRTHSPYPLPRTIPREGVQLGICIS